MSDYLIDSARQLTEDEAGPHGSRWAVFGEPEELMTRWLHPMLTEGKPVESGIPVNLGARRGGMPVALGFLHSDNPEAEGRVGGLSVQEVVPPSGSESGQLAMRSAFPFLSEGVEFESEVFEIALYPNQLEARISIEFPQGAAVDPFDALFWKHGPHYRQGEVYRFRASGLAYKFWPAAAREILIDEPEKIRAFHAREAWAKAHGSYERERDEAAALAAWQPKTPKDLEPIKIKMQDACMLIPRGWGGGDEFSFQGCVADVKPRIFELYGMPLWRVDVTVIRGDEDFNLPMYVAESVFEDAWRPAIGDMVEGAFWLQVHATGIAVSPAQ